MEFSLGVFFFFLNDPAPPEFSPFPLPAVFPLGPGGGGGAGGPFGGVLGAAAGALLGDRYHRQAQASAALAADLHHSEAERSRLSQNVAQLDGSLTQAQARGAQLDRSEEHTSELQSQSISYAVFCLEKKKNHNNPS